MRLTVLEVDVGYSDDFGLTSGNGWYVVCAVGCCVGRAGKGDMSGWLRVGLLFSIGDGRVE